MVLLDHELKIRQEQHDNLMIVQLEGHLTLMCVPKLRSFIERMLSEGHRQLVLDLTRLSFIDSAGVGALVHLRGEVQRAKGGMGMIQSGYLQVKNVLVAAHIPKVVPCFEGIETAKAEYGMKMDAPLPRAATPVPPPPAEQLAGDAVIGQLNAILDRLQKLETRLQAIESRGSTR